MIKTDGLDIENIEFIIYNKPNIAIIDFSQPSTLELIAMLIEYDCDLNKIKPLATRKLKDRVFHNFKSTVNVRKVPAVRVSIEKLRSQLEEAWIFVRDLDIKRFKHIGEQGENSFFDVVMNREFYRERELHNIKNFRDTEDRENRIMIEDFMSPNSQMLIFYRAMSEISNRLKNDDGEVDVNEFHLYLKLKDELSNLLYKDDADTPASSDLVENQKRLEQRSKEEKDKMLKRAIQVNKNKI